MAVGKERFVEVLDTTLRDGEQTPGVAFSPEDKLNIARLLLSHLKVDRIEIGSALVSDRENEALKGIADWANRRTYANQIEVLGFIDNGSSIAWVEKLNCRTINLLAKGSIRHCRIQLRRTPAKHIADVCREVKRAADAGLKVNVYLEDWSNGLRSDLAFICDFVSQLAALPVERIMLADTLGILSPDETARFCSFMTAAFPDVRFDFHGHNDYGLVTANSLSAIANGISGIHATINGLGERAGNQPLAQLVAAVNDLTCCHLKVQEKELTHASTLLENITGKRMAWNFPIVGMDVYTQTCGVHADGDRKGGLYVSKLIPERFGRSRDYALGKLSGHAALEQNLENIPGLPVLDDALREKVLAEIVRLGEKKKNVSASDLPFIVANIMHSSAPDNFKVLAYESTSCLGVAPKMQIKVEIFGKTVEASAKGDGSYDAFVKALKKCLKPFNLKLPKLADYQVRIPPGGRTDAIVETTIIWQSASGRRLTSSAVDSDQLAAAVRATEKMLNLYFKTVSDEKGL